MEALFFRNQFGWALGKTMQLKNDIPAILSLPGYSKELAYSKVFRPQKFPPSEWNRFYAVSDTLCQYFSSDKNVYRELIGIKTMLEFLTHRDNELVNDLPVLLSLLDSTSEMHASLMWEYGQTLLRTDQRQQALIVFEKTYSKTGNSDCFQTMLRMYGTDKSYDKIIALKADILKDSSGTLLFDLGKAYLNTNQQKEAAFYLNAFVSKIEFLTQWPYAQIQHDNIIDHISAEQLETLGDFYSSSDQKKACTYYKLSIKILSDPSPDMRYKKSLSATTDEKLRQNIQKSYDDYLMSKDASATRLDQKLKRCK
ncbi:MAG TPA: hypothetical protein VK796_10595 [Cytophaga sp.]|nr:hypothetical protein [Cytophaga sp.]